MNEYLKEFIELKKNFNNQDGDKASVLALDGECLYTFLRLCR